MADILSISPEIQDRYRVQDNTFFQTAKENIKDRIKVEIGDSKQTDFYPQVKHCRWDNEVNVSYRLVDSEKDSPQIITENGRIKYIKNRIEAHFYDLLESNEHPEGGYEFEVILKEKPKTNVVRFTLVDKGVEYFYQPELEDYEVQEMAERENITLLEAKRKCRPENVVGSYAVYTKESKTNYAGGKEYKCGKVGHIFRPKIVDANGTEVWGDLHIENGILSVTIPQKFLDEAVYPVRHAAGLTFGYTSVGASDDYDFVGNELRGSLFTSPSDAASANSITFYSGYGSSYNVKGVLVLGSNLNIVANGIGNAYSAPAMASDWYTSSFSSNPSLSSNTNYVLMIICDKSYVNFPYDTGSAGQGYKDTSNSYSTPSNPTDAATNNHKHSIYCTYTAGGGTDVTVNPSAQALTCSLPARTISATKTVSITPSPETTTFSLPAITITAESPQVTPYNSFKKNQLNGTINLATDTIKVMLVSSSYVFNQDSHEFLSNITDEIIGINYTAGGAELTGKSVTQDNTADKSKFTGNNVSWSNASFTARGAVIYKDTGNSTTSPLIAFYDFGGDETATNQTFTMQWNSNGIILF